MTYNYAIVVKNSSHCHRDDEGAILVPGDLISLCGRHVADHFTNNHVRYYLSSKSKGLEAISFIKGDEVIPAKTTDIISELEVGDVVQVNMAMSEMYGKVFEVAVINSSGHIYGFVDGTYTGFLNIAVGPYVSKLTKCTCNFYEREAYGCRCGRIVG